MLVRDLIAELKKCPQDADVMYDFHNAWINDDDNAYHFDKSDCPSELCMAVDDVLIGAGTQRGFVFLTEELYPEEVKKDAGTD